VWIGTNIVTLNTSRKEIKRGGNRIGNAGAADHLGRQNDDEEELYLFVEQMKESVRTDRT